MPSNVTIVGSGTSGLVCALILRKTFPNLPLNVLSSSDIGIIGVGEGSTEHWTMFERYVSIDRAEMVAETDATFKFGIRFRNWRTDIPDYVHSISFSPSIGDKHFPDAFSFLVADNKLLTPATGPTGMLDNRVRDIENILSQTNQFHFDTHKLNLYLTRKCKERGIDFIDAVVKDVEVDPSSGDITTIITESGERVETDFVVDCSGFRKVVFSKVGSNTFRDYSHFLQCDSAVVFQTPSEDDGVIKPYTNAQAMSAGWMWEIPTQSRRGNGYVFSSDYINEEQAILEAQDVAGFQVDSYRMLKFSPGYEATPWQKNCVAIGLSSNFIEPLEATSIASSIQQSLMLCSYLPVYVSKLDKLRTEYNRLNESMMENLCSMICLHYVSDRVDTPMWLRQSRMHRPEYLNHLLEIMSIRGLEPHDMKLSGFELFAASHFWHVAQGQNVINKDGCLTGLRARDSISEASTILSRLAHDNRAHKYIPHRDALERGTSNVCRI